jgi:two-component system, chemotaxis family, chemotaxis protein CheY
MSTPRRTILVVDDDIAVLRTVVEILTEEGYHLATATNGAEALDVLEKITPHLILLDMRMPVMDGWQFAQALRGNQQAIPILVMTAAQDARQWAREIGASGYVAKPFDIGDLIDSIERWLPGPPPPQGPPGCA